MRWCKRRKKRNKKPFQIIVFLSFSLFRCRSVLSFRLVPVWLYGANERLLLISFAHNLQSQFTKCICHCHYCTISISLYYRLSASKNRKWNKEWTHQHYCTWNFINLSFWFAYIYSWVNIIVTKSSRYKYLVFWIDPLKITSLNKHNYFQL